MPNMNDFFQLPGLEAIDYQVNSKLAKGLIDIFQEGIDFAAQEYSPGSAASKGRVRADRVLRFCKTTLGPKLIKVVEQETGLLLEQIDWLGGYEQEGVSGIFAMYITQDNAADALETIQRETGVTHDPLGRFFFLADDESYNEMKQMAAKLDLHTGKLSGRRYGMNNRRRIVGRLVFDVNCAFCASEYLPEGVMEGGGLTAAEIAAIICHEIGHVMTMTEHAGDMFRVANRCRSAVRIVPSAEDIQKAGKDTILKSISRSNEILDDLKKQVAVSCDPSIMKQVVKLIDTVQVVGTNVSDGIKAHDDEESVWWVVGSLALFVFFVGYMVFHIAFISVFVLILQLLFLNSLNRACQLDRTALEKSKAGDTRITKNDQFLFERWADEFAARHGLGVPLATGLNKIREVMLFGEFTFHFPIFSTTLLRNGVFSTLCRLYTKVMEQLLPLQVIDPTIYEFQTKRIRRVRENVYDYFKSCKDVPLNTRKEWINSVDQLIEEEKNSRRWQTSEFVQFAIRNITKLASPIEWATFIKNGHLSDDFTFLQDAIDAMKHNSMYYFAEKFDLKRYDKK